MPSWVTPTQCPPDSSASPSQTSTVSALWCGAWAHVGGTGAPVAGPPHPAPLPGPSAGGGIARVGRCLVPPAVGFVDGGPNDEEALGDPLQRRKHPLTVCPRGGPREEASHEDILQAELAREQRPEDVRRACDTLQGPPPCAGGPPAATLSRGPARGGGPALGHTAPSSLASASPTCSIARGARAAARAGLAGTGSTARGPATARGGTAHCASSLYV